MGKLAFVNAYCYCKWNPKSDSLLAVRIGLDLVNLVDLEKNTMVHKTALEVTDRRSIFISNMIKYYISSERLENQELLLP